MSEWKCGRCGTVYGFDEWMTLGKVKAVPDDPDPKKNYGYTTVCRCGYIFHREKPQVKTYGEVKHNMTSLHWLVNKLSLGRLAKPEHIDIWLSTVFLELAHNTWQDEPMWYESMFFPTRPEGKNKIDCWMQERYRTEVQAIEGHARWKGLLAAGKYRITYHLEKVDYKDPNTKYRFEWRIDFDDSYTNLLHGARVYTEEENDIPNRLDGTPSTLRLGEARR